MKQYPIQIYYIEEDDGTGYYYAFHPDFGSSACSATGDTIHEAINELSIIRKEVMDYYKEKGYPIPDPSPLQADPRTV